MSKFIIIKEEEIPKLSTKRLLNIFRINRTHIFQTLAASGYDTSDGGQHMNLYYINDEFFNDREFNSISYLNERIKNELDRRKNE